MRNNCNILQSSCCPVNVAFARQKCGRKPGGTRCMQGPGDFSESWLVLTKWWRGSLPCRKGVMFVSSCGLFFGPSWKFNVDTPWGFKCTPMQLLLGKWFSSSFVSLKMGPGPNQKPFCGVEHLWTPTLWKSLAAQESDQPSIPSNVMLFLWISIYQLVSWLWTSKQKASFDMHWHSLEHELSKHWTKHTKKVLHSSLKGSPKRVKATVIRSQDSATTVSLFTCSRSTLPRAEAWKPRGVSI